MNEFLNLEPIIPLFNLSVCTFIAAVVTEGIAYLQPHIRNYYLSGKSSRQRKTIMTVLYGFQQLLGWLLMLISMTFSIELFASVVMGLFFGKLLFPAEASVIQNNTGGRAPESMDSNGNERLIGENAPLLPEEPLPQPSPTIDGSSDSSIRRRRR